MLASYVRDILTNTSKSLETVTIEPNGRWSVKGAEEEWRSAASNGAEVAADYDDDDDDLEISEVNVLAGGRRVETPVRRPLQGSSSTPASGGRDNAAANGPRGLGSTSGKRPAPEVIDLTLSSDDDDDEPIQRPAKRQATSTNGYRGPSSSMGFLSESPLGYPM